MKDILSFNDRLSGCHLAELAAHFFLAIFADFQQNLFEGSKWLLAWADKIEEIKTVCWCGKGARCNARIDAKGRIIRAGEQVMVGANESYISLCRKHFNQGKTKK